jgi:AraC family ethanolamine operon transcriptional activator
MISMGSLSRRAPADWRGSLLTATFELGARSAKPINFHEYADRVAAPNVNLMLTKPGCGNWRIARQALGRIVMQSGATGGATVSDGIAQPGSFVFLLQGFDPARPVFLNGRVIAGNDVAVLPPGKPFALACRGPHRWMSLSVPPEALKEAGFSPAQLHQLEMTPSPVDAPSPARRQLAAAVIDAIDLVRSNPVSSRVDRFSDVERDLLANLFAALGSGDSPTHAISCKSSCNLDRINLRALAFIRSRHDLDLNVEHLCRAIGVAERSLLRAFHRFFGIGPTRYLKLRRLNQVHRALQACECTETTVTGVMTTCGVTEFGRFAGAYRALFGEAPSETLRRKLEALDRMHAVAGTRATRPEVVASARTAAPSLLAGGRQAVV